MLKISRIVLPEPTRSEQVFLDSLLQSARGLGWEMPRQQAPVKVAEAAVGEAAESPVNLPVQGSPA